MKYYKHAKTGEVYAYDQQQIDGGWVKEGLVPMTDDEVHAHLNPPPPPPVVPAQVTRAQGKAALVQAGHWPAVLDYVAKISDPTDRLLAEIALNDTVYWQRESPFLKECAKAIGLSEDQLDGLFTLAASIVL